ncbi:MAG: FAD-dependent oxidoreductase, partial [Candidatus Eisenbacteria bacterium]
MEPRTAQAVTSFDLVVVGGGITGLGIARLAARNGLTVAVLERGDLAAGASSASSHMLHGGLRYLEHGHYRLVRESLRERAAVARLAPDLAHPTRFVLPFYRGDRRPPWMVRAGLLLYDALAGRANLAPHAAVQPREALALEPDLAPAGLLGAGLYSDVVMDDVRLA